MFTLSQTKEINQLHDFFHVFPAAASEKTAIDITSKEFHDTHRLKAATSPVNQQL
jgi:hypothetical protein